MPVKHLVKSLPVTPYCRIFLTVLLVAALLCFAQAASAQDRIIDDIRISRVGDTTTIYVQMACAMRFQSDFALESATLIELRMAPFDNCRQVSAGRSEIRRPLNGGLAGLIEVEYEPLGDSDGLLLLRFDNGVAYSVSQATDLRTIVITLDATAPPAPDRPRTVEAQAVDMDASDDAAQPDDSRRPLSARIVEAEETADFIINLRSTQDPIDASIAAGISVRPEQRIYVSRTQVDGQTWFRLRLGFFDSEATARNVLQELTAQFPRAWIGRAEPEEVATAREFELTNDADQALPLVAAEALESTSPASAELVTRPPQEIAAQMTAAREALLANDTDTAIRLYLELVQTDGEHRAEASEYLGVAYERAGLTARAKAQYESYTREFPANVGIVRVRQRLNGIVMAQSQPPVPLREAAAQSRWNTAFGISQYYRRSDNRFDEDQETVTTLSAFISDIDLSVRRQGGRVDLSGRVSLSHFHDMLDEARREDQQRFSYAYFDVESTARQWWLRLGRQTLHNFGVMGRFDGARFDYAWSPDRILHVVTGHPVESTRDSVETDRQLYGAAVEFQDLVGDWDFSFFLNHQSIESLDAREALGMEVRYADSKRTLTGIVDYDADYGELNTLLMLGTWRLNSGLTLSALLDERKSPILTTRNALIGQPVATVEELLLVWDEEEIRQLAIDRTADSSTLTLGIAAPLGQRFQLNFDYTTTELTGTAESGGVAAIESTGPQSFYSTSLVGSGLFGSNDVSIFNVRFGSSEQFRTTTFTWDARFPIGRRVRLNPRIRYNSWEGLLNGRKRDSVSPTLRLLINTRRHYRIEFEMGSERETRVDPLVEREASGNFVNLGYRANF